MQVITIGLDLAKHWFQVHGVDANGHCPSRDQESDWLEVLLLSRRFKI